MMASQSSLLERAFSVVGEDDGVDLGDEFGSALAEALGFGLRRRLAALDVETQKLLHAADDAGFGDGGQ